MHRRKLYGRCRPYAELNSGQVDRVHQVVRLDAAQAPLDFASLQRQGNSIDYENRRADLDLQPSMILGGRQLGMDFFLGTHDVDAEVGLIQRIERIGERASLFDGGEKFERQYDDFVNRGTGIDEPRSRDFNDTFRAIEIKLAALDGADRPDLHRLGDAFGRQALAARARQTKKAKQRALLGIFGDIGAFSLAPLQEFFSGESIEHLAHRALTDPQLLGQIELAGQRFPGPPSPLCDLADDDVIDLSVEWTIAGSFCHKRWPPCATRLPVLV